MGSSSITYFGLKAKHSSSLPFVNEPHLFESWYYGLDQSRRTASDETPRYCQQSQIIACNPLDSQESGDLVAIGLVEMLFHHRLVDEPNRVLPISIIGLLLDSMPDLELIGLFFGVLVQLLVEQNVAKGVVRIDEADFGVIVRIG